jgi:hypothetical protein
MAGGSALVRHLIWRSGAWTVERLRGELLARRLFESRQVA